MPRVSVLIPAYNQGRYLAMAIRSALEQTYSDIEVLVVDDGSTDETAAVARAFTDPRVSYVYQDNQGLSAARNTGIRRATGEFLTFLDADDLFLPEKLSLLLAAIDENPQWGFVAGQAVLIDENGKALGEVFDRGLPADRSELLLSNPLHVGSVLLRRRWQQEVGYFDEMLRSYEDWDYWLRLARAGCPMGWVPRPVSQYRFHRQQMTRIGRQMTTATFAVLDKVYCDPDLPQAWLARRDEAYSRASLRAAAQAYTAGEVDEASQHMAAAVRLDPSLAAHDGERVARLAAGWANHAKTADPLAFLEQVYAHLPDELAALRRRRRADLAKEALQLAFAAYNRGDLRATRTALWHAIGYRPACMRERGVLALLARSIAPRTAARRAARLAASS
jgi:hypothetical protein